MRKTLLLTITLLCGVMASLQGAYPQTYVNAPTVDRSAIDSLKLRLNNQESELRTYEQKLESLDAILESLQDQLKDQSSQHKDLIKGSATSNEQKIAAIESTVKTLTADIKQLHTHSNDTVSTLNTFKQKLQELDQRLTTQNRNMENLQTALQSVLDALQVKADLPNASTASGRTYKIKNGDSLEKIARMHNTSIGALKELNQITSDKIVVGKTLKIPD